MYSLSVCSWPHFARANNPALDLGKGKKQTQKAWLLRSVILGFRKKPGHENFISQSQSSRPLIVQLVKQVSLIKARSGGLSNFS